jgi:hypothetical protein
MASTAGADTAISIFSLLICWLKIGHEKRGRKRKWTNAHSPPSFGPDSNVSTHLTLAMKSPFILLLTLTTGLCATIYSIYFNQVDT